MLKKLTHILSVLFVLFIAAPAVRADPISIALLGALGIQAAAGSTIVAVTTALLVAGASAAAGLGLSAIAARLNRPKPTDAGRQDIRLTSSRYGEPVRRVYKRMVMGGQVIYRSPVRTIVDSQQVGSGKRRQTVNTSRYSASWGVLFCENVNDTVLGITKIWLDGKLVYPPFEEVCDDSDPPICVETPFNEALLDGSDQMVRLYSTENYPNDLSGDSNPQAYIGGARQFRIALGNAAQTQATVADWYASQYGGTSFIPAYRGYVTTWWHDMDMRPYYNRLPQVQAEILTSHDTLKDAVQAECEYAGIATGNLAMTELNDVPMLGGYVDGPIPPKQTFENWSLYSRFAVVQVDGKVTGLRLPRDASLAPDGNSSVNNGYLGTKQAGVEEKSQQEPAKFVISIEQTGELPKIFDVTWFDPDNRYQQASYPYVYPLGDATRHQQVFLQMGMKKENAISIASNIASTVYTERSVGKFALPPSFFQYHAADVLTFPAPNNQLVDIRIAKMTGTPGKMVEVEGIRQMRKSNVGVSLEDNPDNVSQVGPGEGGSAANIIIHSVWVISNVPPLIDDHDGFDGVYWAAGPLLGQTNNLRPWTGAVLIRNACGSDDSNKQYEVVAGSGTPATIGKALTSLASATGVDTTNTVDIDLPYGHNPGLFTIHNDAWTNVTTMNLCILGREVLQFKTVADVSASYSLPAGRVWRLSNLKRGLRDTAGMVATHAIDDSFVLWEPAAVVRVPVNLDEIEIPGGPARTFNYKSFSEGQTEADINPTAVTVADTGMTYREENPG